MYQTNKEPIGRFDKYLGFIGENIIFAPFIIYTESTTVTPDGKHSARTPKEGFVV